MSAWISANHKSNPIGFERIDKDTGYVLFPKSTLNLMQNCDLPPPLKLFSGPNETFLSKEKDDSDEHVPTYGDCSRNDKLEILKALRLSQTRAREAERKLRALIKEKDELSDMLVDDSLRLFAYRQWVHMMELQILKLQRQQNEQNMQRDYNEDGISSKNLYAAIGLCLAIAGMGFALGYSYLF